MAQSVAEPTEDLEEYLRFESLLLDLSTRFINLPADQVGGEISDVQRRVRETSDGSPVTAVS